MKKITRQFSLEQCNLHLREAEGEEESRTVVGHAVVFGVRSCNLVPWSSIRELYEIIEPGAITPDLIKNSDVVLTAYHNNEMIMGRSRYGKGTLKLSIDEVGMPIECALARTQAANDSLELIRRNDISGMSFAYTTDEEDTENCVSYERTEEKTADGKEVWLRHVKKITGLYDVTIAGHPAFPQTDIKEQREISEAMLERIERPIREAEEKEQRVRDAEIAAHNQREWELLCLS